MGRSFAPGFRAPAFGIQTQGQMLLFCILTMAVMVITFLIICHFAEARIAIISPFLVCGGLRVFTWARFLALGVANDTGDLIIGIAMLALAAGIIGLYKIKCGTLH